VWFRLSPLGQATLKLSRSGTGQALFARQVGVPWRQHAANRIGRQLASSENDAGESFRAFVPTIEVFASNHCAFAPRKKVFASNQF
jgi:hypothetical protein